MSCDCGTGGCDIKPANDSDKTMGMLCHLLGLIGFIGPLIIWLIKKDESKFVDANGKEALNFQITVLIAFIAIGFAAPFTFGLLALLIPVVGLADLVFIIIASMEVNKGKLYRYPLCLRLIK